MSAIKNQIADIVEAYQNGMTYDGIVQLFEVSHDFVDQVITQAIEDDPNFFADGDDPYDPCERDYQYDDSMDGDTESALASAGWGTDEDYGCYGGDDY